MRAATPAHTLECGAETRVTEGWKGEEVYLDEMADAVVGELEGCEAHGVAEEGKHRRKLAPDHCRANIGDHM